MLKLVHHRNRSVTLFYSPFFNRSPENTVGVKTRIQSGISSDPVQIQSRSGPDPVRYRGRVGSRAGLCPVL